MEINEILAIFMFVSFIGLLFTGIPVGYVLAGVGVLFGFAAYLSDIYLDTITGIDFNTMGLVVSRIFSMMSNWILVALPMFIFMGLMLDRSGVAEKLMLSMQELFGKVRGGLAITVTLIGVILAASTGIIGASVVLLGLLSLPAMLGQGYNKSLSTGTICSAGALGILLPPSIMLVIMADQLALSVGDLFMAAVIPGLLLGVLYISYIFISCYLKPDLAPLPDNQKPLELKDFMSLFKHIIPPLLLILSVLGSIFSGICTPTEASGIGALGATLLAAYNKKLSFASLKEVSLDTYRTTAYIFTIFIGATMFALILRELGGDELIEDAFTSLPFGQYGVLIAILFVIFLLGFLLDWIEITLIALPLFTPIILGLDFAVNGYGVVDDPSVIWFVMLVAITLQTSFLTPPVGFALFYLKGVCPQGVSLGDIYKGVVPFIALQLVGLAVVLMYPSLTTWLPAEIYGN